MAKKVCCLIGASSKWMPTGVSAMNENGGKAITEEFPKLDGELAELWV